MSHDFNGQI